MTTAKEIMSTDFPRWTEIADVLDGPEQEVVECQSTFKENCQWPRCDCDRHAKCECNRPDCPLCAADHDKYCLCPSCRIKKYEEEKKLKEYAHRINTELRTYDAHLKRGNNG